MDERAVASPNGHRVARAGAWVETEAAEAPPLAWRLAALLASSLLTLAFVEGVVRLRDGGALPKLRLFAAGPSGRIVLAPGADVWVGGPAGAYRVATDGVGTRAAYPSGEKPAPGQWLVVGDSQVLGMGLPWEDTFAARAREKGVRLLSAGVPGYGLEDALAHAAGLVPHLRPAGLVVVVNQANDWEEWGSPIEERFQARGGWLLGTGDASSLGGRFMATPLSRSHLLFFAGQFVFRDGAEQARKTAAPPWMAAPDRQAVTSAAMGEAIRRFARHHRPLPTVACFLPVDFATSAARARVSPFAPALKGLTTPPWEERHLRDQLGRALPDLPFLDLTEALEGRPEAFQEGDYHLSAPGHAAVADLLARRLEALGTEGGGIS